MIDLAERCDYITIKDKLNGKAAFIMSIVFKFYLRISFMIFKNFSFISGLPRLTRFMPT